MLRPKTKDMADKLAESMITACNNDNIGYCQGHRLGIVKYGINSKVKTEADCGTTVRACIIHATGKDVGNFTTSNENLYFFLVACLMTLEVMRQEWFFTTEMLLSQKQKVIQRL